MALSTLAKIGIIGCLIAGISVGCSYLKESKFPPKIQRILDWERNNGGCKILLAVEYSSKKFYRPGTKENKLSDEKLDSVWKDIETDAENSKDNKEKCKEHAGKKLWLAWKNNKWSKDTNSWE